MAGAAFRLAEARARVCAELANAGIPVEVRQKFTGHASAEMNAHYTHHEIETLRSAIGKLPTVRP